MTSRPSQKRNRCLHGFTLLHHAEKGGEDAAELYDYISELGLTETFIKTFDKG